MIKICFSLTIFAISQVLASSTDVSNRLKEIGLVLENHPFNEVVSYQIRKSEKMSFKRLHLKGDSKFLQIEMISGIKDDAALRFFQTKESLFFNLYKNRPTPYRGQFTNLVTCSKEFSPVSKTLTIFGKKQTFYMAKAGSRFNFGICEKKDIAYEGAYLLINDQAYDQLLEIKFFSNSKKDFSSLIKGLKHTNE